jgi:glycosyltransferase involved in cell wall biosynthesis
MRFLIIAGLADSLLNFRGPLIAALQSRKLEVHVAAPDLTPDSPLRQRLEDSGLLVHDIPLRRTGTNPVADIHTMVSLWRVMRRIRPQFVLGYTIKPVIYGTLAAWLAGVPHRFALITGLGYVFQGKDERGHLLYVAQRLYALALSRAKMVFFQNPDDEALFRQRGILTGNAASCVVNGSGVDLVQFNVSPLPSGPLRFLLIARLLGDKGVREYIEAARRVREKHPDVIFYLVGWIDENPDSVKQDELDAWIAEDVVKFLGRLDDVRSAIQACNVYVLPSYREGTPRTVLEAMAMGRAIITTDAPGCRETVIEGDNGFLVPVKSVVDLEHAILKFIKTPLLATNMGVSSRKLAEQKYDVHKINAVMLHEMEIK